MSVLTILSAQLETFSQGEKRIAEFVLSAPSEAVRLPSAKLAEKIGASQSSVVKFCQKLGFSGYQDFRLALSEASAQTWTVDASAVQGSIGSSDSFSTTTEKLVGSKIHAMQQTVSVNREAAMTSALEFIRKARRVQLVGVGASSLVARDFAYKLQKLGLTVLYDADSHIQIANATTLGPRDVVFALSYSGSSMETLSIAKSAKELGATVVSLTNVSPNQLSDLADVQLYVTADEEKARSSAITSRDAQLFVTDWLFILLVQAMPKAAERVQAAEQAAAKLKS